MEYWTFPKAGTFMMKDFFSYIKRKYGKKVPNVAHIPQSTNTYTDYPKDTEVYKLAQKQFSSPQPVFNPKRKHVIAIRDLRDCLVSIVNWLPKDQYQLRVGHPNLRRWKKLSFDQRLSEYINLDQKMWPRGIIKSCYLMLNEIKNLRELNEKHHNILFIRFEDLMSTKHGGDDAVRFNTVKKVCNYFNLKLNDSQLKDALEYLDKGKSLTFNSEVKKKIGQWRVKFNSQHVADFKKIWGQHLIDLGYEESFDWDIVEELEKCSA